MGLDVDLGFKYWVKAFGATVYLWHALEIQSDFIARKVQKSRQIDVIVLFDCFGGGYICA